jgi:2,3-bisphosphoglycerate-independent phosphoglycerate mutase
MDHSGEPLPLVIWGPHVRTDSVTEYGERPSAKGCLQRVSGKDVMKLLSSYTLRADKFGA